MKPLPALYWYSRWSTDRQSAGSSDFRQNESADWLAAELGLPLDDSRRFTDSGLSAAQTIEVNGERVAVNLALGKLGIFLDEVRHAKIAVGSYLGVDELSRLSRQNALSVAFLIKQIVNAGIFFVTVKPFRVFTKEKMEDDIGFIISQLVESDQHNKFVTNLTAKVNGSWAKKRATKCYASNNCPNWLYWDKENCRYQFVEGAESTVRRVIELAEQGYGIYRTASILNKEGRPTFTRNKRKRAKWTDNYVAQILASRTLFGEHTPTIGGKKAKDVWADFYPALITKERWESLQRARQVRHRKMGRTGRHVANLFANITFSVYDRTRLQIFTHSKRVPRLISATYRNGAAIGDRRSFPYLNFEEALLGCLIDRISIRDLFAPSAQPNETKLERLLAERDATIAKQELLRTHFLAADLEKSKTLLTTFADLDDTLNHLNALIEREEAIYRDYRPAVDELQALHKLLNEKPENLEDVRTKLRQTIRTVVESVWVAMYGEPNSHYKSCFAFVFFRAGGMKTVWISAFHDITHAHECSYDPAIYDVRLNPLPSTVQQLLDHGQDNHALFCQQKPSGSGLTIIAEGDSGEVLSVA